jgi:hypothetical protein
LESRQRIRSAWNVLGGRRSAGPVLPSSAGSSRSQAGKTSFIFSDQTAKDKKVISQFDFSTVHFYGLHDFRQKDTQTNAIKMMPN